MNRAPRLNGLAQQNRAHVNSPLVVLIMSDYLVAIRHKFQSVVISLQGCSDKAVVIMI